MSESAFAVQTEDQPSWAEIVRHAEHGESVSVIAHGHHVAEIVMYSIAMYSIDDRKHSITVLAVAHRLPATVTNNRILGPPTGRYPRKIT